MTKSSYTQEITVTREMTAAYMGSGTLEVFSTPALCAFMENTAIKAITLPEDETSLGVEINIEHLKASMVGETLTAKAEVVAHEGHSIYLQIEVKNSRNEIVGSARHTRVVVNTERFLSKLENQPI